MISDHVADMRRTYALGGLDEADLAPDPLTQFARWFADAQVLREPNAMVLATATAASDAAPSARFVLLKGYDERGFVFFTNYGSRKAGELTANPRAALLFPWHDLERQVRVEGSVTRVSAAETADYFESRPRGSRLGAWASPQSQVLPDRAALQERFAEVAAGFGDGPVPVPDFWGGYRVEPSSVEFWQGREDRLHDRLVYRRAAAAAAAAGAAGAGAGVAGSGAAGASVAGAAGAWRVERLAP